jgi:hypothetical protein
MCNGPDDNDSSGSAAALVGRNLKRSKPQELPFEEIFQGRDQC